MKIRSVKSKVVLFLSVLSVIAIYLTYYFNHRNTQPKIADVTPYSSQKIPVDSFSPEIKKWMFGLIHDKDEIFQGTVGNALRTLAERDGKLIKFEVGVDTNQLLQNNKALYEALLNYWIQKYNKPGLYFSVHNGKIQVDTAKNKYNF